MKIPKKFKAILLAIVMLLSMSLNDLVVSAEDSTTQDTGSITIHKYVEPTTGTGLPNDGTKIDEENEILGTLTPLKDITFKITKMELAENANAQGAIKANNDLWYVPISDGAFPPSTIGPTNDKGMATLDNLPLGVYYIEELGNGTTFGRESFFVTIPMVDPAADKEGYEGDGYLYDIHVYPKNETIDIVKKLDEDSLGDNIVGWSIKTNIPNDVDKGKSFVITDALDPRLQYVAGSIKVYGDADGDGSPDGEAISPSLYNFDNDNETTSSKKTLEIKFSEITANSMEELAKYKDGNIIITFNTMIVTPTGGDLGEIDNDAGVTYTNENDSTFNKNTGELDLDPHVTALGIDILKYGDGDEENLLENAVFSILDANEQPIINPATSSAWTVTTNEFGHADIYGLTTGTYYLVETAAPTGYKLLNAPIEIEIIESEGKVFTYKINGGDSVDVGGDYILDVEIDNASGFVLPLTGGTGTMLFTFIGLLLIGAAIVIYTISKKKKEQNA